MQLTKTFVENAVKNMRTAVPCATVAVRHVESGQVFKAIRSSLNADMVLTMYGTRGKYRGSVRAIVSELRRPYPTDNQTLEMKINGEREKLTILGHAFEQSGATVRFDFGEEYA